MFRPATMSPTSAPQTLPSRLGQGVAFRFEVTDESGSKFVPNAAVTLWYEDGTVLVSKTTDGGGNAAFSEAEIGEAAAAKGLGGADGVFWYTVEAPGYQAAEEMVYEGAMNVPTGKIFNIALKGAVSRAPSNALLVGGVTTAILIGIGLSL